jgi:hypothetical protein
MLRFKAGDWSATAWHARRFVDRLVGVRRQGVEGLFMQTWSVHTFGLRQPISVVGLDSGGTVSSTMVLRPNRVVVIPGTRHILELPAGHDLPAVGDRLEVVSA